MFYRNITTVGNPVRYGSIGASAIFRDHFLAWKKEQLPQRDAELYRYGRIIDQPSLHTGIRCRILIRRRPSFS